MGIAMEKFNDSLTWMTWISVETGFSITAVQ
jgi:hypothetical protein